MLGEYSSRELYAQLPNSVSDCGSISTPVYLVSLQHVSLPKRLYIFFLKVQTSFTPVSLI